MNRSRSSRGPNFSTKDRALLLNIVHRYLDVIENKRTDGVWVKLKEDAWQKITHEFNNATAEVHRSAHQLKVAYQNYKRRMKKPAAGDTTEIYENGIEAVKRKLDVEGDGVVSRLRVKSSCEDNHPDSDGQYIVCHGEEHETDEREGSLVEVLCHDAMRKVQLETETLTSTYDSRELHGDGASRTPSPTLSSDPLKICTSAAATVLSECTSTKLDFNQLRCKLMLEKHDLEMEILKTNLRVAQVELKIKEGILAKQKLS